MRQFSAIALLSVLMVTTGCPLFKHHKPPVADPDLDPTARIHHLEVTWSYDDLTALKDLEIRHESEIEVVDGGTVDQMSVVFGIEVRSKNLDLLEREHEAQAEAYVSRFRSESKLNSDHPQIISRQVGCNPVNEDTLSVCIGRMRVILPSAKALPMKLSWLGNASIQGIHSPNLVLNVPASDGATRVMGVFGNVEIAEGTGSAKHSVFVDGVYPWEKDPGNFTAKMSHSGVLMLSQIAGRVRVNVGNPAQTHVQLDGTPITRFPFQRH